MERLMKKRQKRNITALVLSIILFTGVSASTALSGSLFHFTSQKNTILQKLEQQRVLFLGENHESMSNHLAHLEIIKRVHKKSGKKMVIGIEYLPRESQMALDRYIEHKTDETGFLRESHYFINWGYNYLFYKPIFDFARNQGIKIIALNINRELNRTIGYYGLSNLSPEQLKMLPSEIDFENSAHKERIREVFLAHGSHSTFQNFYTAQLIWDEVMAETAARYYIDNGKPAMVILAGNGHIAYRNGIPDRFTRRTGEKGFSVLFDSSIDANIAEMLVVTDPVESPPQAMIGLTFESPMELVVKSVVREDQLLQKGDHIISLDGKAVNTIEDVRVFTYRLKPGDTVEIFLEREGKKVKVTLPLL